MGRRSGSKIRQDEGYSNYSNFSSKDKPRQVNDFHPEDLNPIDFKPRNKSQIQAFRTLGECDLTFLIGPAGTAKTYLAVAQAMEDLKSGRATKIIAARPAIEAGDSIGYLKGDLLDKMGPYVRPILDCMGKFLGPQTVQLMQESQVDMLEITSMTYLRGRTFEDAVLILDEMQNATVDQLRLGLTRAGKNCRVIVTGDPTQIDLPDRSKSALCDVDRFRGLPSIGFCDFQINDIERSEIVKTVLRAYEH